MDFVTRAIELAGGIVDMERGTFPLIIASEGEAKDGHIFSVRGVKPPSTMPMLFNHKSTAEVPSLGTMGQFRKDKVDGIHILRSIGQFRMDGTGPLADIRRDFAHLVNEGDLPGASVRWTGPGTPRRSLGRNHEFFAQRGNIYQIPEMSEGSIVAVGSDPMALNGRSEAADSEPVKVFWRVLANAEQNEEGHRNVGEAFAAYLNALDGLRKAGCTPEDVMRITDIQDVNVFRYTFGDETISLPEAIYDHITSTERALLSQLISKDEERKPSTEERKPSDSERKPDEPTSMDVFREALPHILAGVERTTDTILYRRLGKDRR